MKIRIQGNSVRFRLTRSEVHKLCETGAVEEKTHFKDNTFHYSVVLSTKHHMMTAKFDKETICLFLPEREGINWHIDERVGFNSEMFVGQDIKLTLLLEKDFVCLQPRAEDESDNYPNPKLKL